MKNLLLVSLLMVCVGCVSYAPSMSLTGQNREAVIKAMGPPHSEVVQPNGLRLVYPRGPAGKNTFFVHLDTSGRVTHWEDVLVASNFQRITPGMTREEVVNLIGPSLNYWSVAKGNHTIWNYPFVNSICQIFQVEITPEGRVDTTGYGYAPECGNDW